MDAQELKATLLDLKSRLEDIKVNVFQIEDKKKRLEEIENELSQEKVWSDLELSQKLSKEKTNLQKIISKYQTVDQKVSDSEVLIDISIEEKDDSAIKEVNQEVLEIYELIEDFEFSRMFNKKIMLIFNILIGLITIYVIICLVIFLSQRKLLYHPNENNYLDENKLTHKIEKVFVKSDNKLIGWHHFKDRKYKTLCCFN